MRANTVLVVDDSPTDQHVLAGLLVKIGIKTLTASSGEEALRVATQEKPDLILMDIVMPGMNGFEATRMLSRNPETAGIPVVIVSSKGQETDKLWGMRQGARDYLVKPIDERTLLAKIQQL